MTDPYVRRRTDESRAFAQAWGALLLHAAVLTLATALVLDPTLVCEDCFRVPLASGAMAGLALTIVGGGRRCRSTRPRPVPAAARRTQPSEVKRVARIGEILVCELGCLGAQELVVALSRRRQRGGPLGRILVEMGLVSPAQLEEALEMQDWRRRLYGVDPWAGSVRACT